jgi:tetraacyldisaccharide 4'-kinase
MSFPKTLAGWALIPLSWLYGLAAAGHRFVMHLGAHRRRRPDCAVVSVGALTVGGAGKTPLAARIAAGLRARGHRVVLASRGYRGKSREAITVVSDGVHIHAYVADAGDESLVLAGHAPGVPVLVGRDRNVVGHHAVSKFGAEILVLDDGFQHHRLPRDLDIVSLDAHAGLGNGRVLPAGPLREPACALKHADWLCVIDAHPERPVTRDPHAGLASLPGSSPRLAQLARDRFVFRATRRPAGLFSLDGRARLAPAELAGRRIGLICGIARPGSFRRSVESLGAEVIAERFLPDHHAYGARDLADLAAGAETWLTTEKDAIKILPSWVRGVSMWVLRIELEIEDESAVLDALERSLQDRGRLTGGASDSGGAGAAAATLPARSTRSSISSD